jgi:PKD repeat protein
VPKTLKYLLALICLISSDCFSQKEANNWYFGLNAAIGFTNGVPVSLPNSAMSTPEGCASVSDKTGALLFYTNGQEVWNKNHQTMANGSNIIGSPSSTQSSLIVKKPGSNTVYYLFTTWGAYKFAYSIIDMSKAVGMGSVTVKNVILLDTVSEKLCGTMHCNGYDVWVIAHPLNSDAFYSFLLDSSGVNQTPVISQIGNIHNSHPQGNMKISPNGKKLALVRLGLQSNNVELFDFNKSSGQVSNAVAFTVNYNAYGCEFSPDGTKLYIEEGSFIKQWDLCSGTQSAIIASGQIIGTDTFLRAMQLAPDGKIYIANGHSSAATNKYVSAIANPNAAGINCGYVPKVVNLSIGQCGIGLPNFMGSMFREKVKINSNTSLACGSASFSYSPPEYCPAASYSVNSVLWDFGDSLASAPSKTSTLANPTHVYQANGTYTVILVAYYPCYTDTVKQIVNITTLPSLSVSGKTNICKGESTKLSFNGATTYTFNGASVPQSSTVVQPATTTVYTLIGMDNGCRSVKTLSITILACTGPSKLYASLNQIHVYPNPANQELFIDCDTAVSIEIYDCLGSLVKSIDVNSDVSKVLIDAFVNGVYFIKVGHPSGNSILKFVKTD